MRLLLLLWHIPGCANSTPSLQDGRTEIEVWYHAGRASERSTLEDQVRRFNERQDTIWVSLVFLPEGSYNAMVQVSAVAGQLPDLLDVDGPYLPSLAWQGHLRPIQDLLPDSVLEDVLPSILREGTYDGQLFGLGVFDSGLGLYASREALESVGARLPTEAQEAWTEEEFQGILTRLSQRDPDGAVLDLKLNYTGEWYTYALQPVLRSAGGALVRGEPPRASGALDGVQSARVLGIVQSWIASGLVDPNLDDAAFTTGRAALSWSGHWDYTRYAEALGEDLAVLPLPDFGTGTRTGQGSWLWTIPRTSGNSEAVAELLRFLLGPDEVLAMARANGAVPGTRTAAVRSQIYGPGGPLSLFLRQLTGGTAVPRPRSPLYPVLSSLFQEAFDAIRENEPLERVLRETVEQIDREVEDNRGYPRL